VTKLLIKALGSKDRSMAWDLYLAKFPDMTKKTFISFDDFYNKPKVNEKTADEIRLEFNEIKKIHQKKR